MPDISGPTNLHIGQMDGRLTALESRIDRHETFVTAKLTAIETKLDDVLLRRPPAPAAPRRSAGSSASPSRSAPGCMAT